MRISLVHIRGSREGQRQSLELGQEGRVIGRLPGCDVALDPLEDALASARHFELVWASQGLVLRDLGSSNGTLLNGERVGETAQVRDGDVIECGEGGPAMRVIFEGSPLAEGEAPDTVAGGLRAVDAGAFMFADLLTDHEGAALTEEQAPPPEALAPRTGAASASPPVDAEARTAPLDGEAEGARPAPPRGGQASAAPQGALASASPDEDGDAPPDEDASRGVGRRTLRLMLGQAQTDMRRAYQRSGRRLLLAIAALVCLLIVAIVALILLMIEGDRTRESVEQTQANLEAQRQSVEAARETIDRTQEALSGARETIDRTQQELSGAHEKLDDTRQELARAQARLDETQTRLDETVRDRDALFQGLNHRLDENRSLLDRTRTEVSEEMREAFREQREEMSRAIRNVEVDITRTYGGAVFMLAFEPDPAAMRQALIPIPEGQSGYAQGFCTAFAVHPDGWLATNAHCLEGAIDVRYDFERMGIPVRFFARRNGDSTTVFPLDMETLRAHPEYTHYASADVGIIRVQLEEGARLEPVTSLASDAQLEALTVAQSIYTLGFPGRVMDAYDVSAHFRGGHVANLTNYDGGQEVGEPNHWVWHTALTSKGTSGSPIFATFGPEREGRVIAVNNGILSTERIVTHDGEVEQVKFIYSAEALNFGIRADVLRAVMVAEGLDVPSAPTLDVPSLDAPTPDELEAPEGQ